ncbi:MAG: 5-methyltetrahydropteroyltriglutamate--homocysteine S-methyltransferase, partial [Alphaproteobacteria bacterium]
MPARKKPPFHADHVGSLLRPKELLDARQKRADGTLSRAELRKVEDKCIREAVAMQESLGLKAVTDGEFRRTYWHVDFLVGIEGIREKTEPGEQPRFKVSGWRPPVLEIAGKVRHAKPIMGPDFDYLKSVGNAMPKVCIPAPGVAHFRGGRAAVDKKAYPEMGEFFADLAAAYRAEVA